MVLIWVLVYIYIYWGIEVLKIIEAQIKANPYVLNVVINILIYYLIIFEIMVV